MSKQNKATLLSKVTDFINRVAPFDANPLIQKTEDLEVRTDYIDSAVFEIPTQKSSNPLTPTFNIDFSLADEHLIDISLSGESVTSFELQNLKGNSVGKIKITKNSTTQSIAFANATVNGALIQEGETSLDLLVFIVNGVYNVVPFKEGNATLRDSAGVETRTQTETKVIEIGDWDMDTDTAVTVAHGITDSDKIRSFDVIIRSDLIAAKPQLDNILRGGHARVLGTGANIVIERNNAGVFDNISYDSIAYNRGWIYITYEV